MSARRGAARLGPVLAAALTAAALAACGSSGHGSATQPAGTTGATTPAAPLAVRPAKPTTSTEIGFGFTAPVATGDHGSTDTSYSLSVTGPAGRGCVGVHEATGPTAARGQAVTITVGPNQLGKPWCAGLYTARVLQLASAACRKGTPCPQYIRVAGTVAQGRFHVTRG